MRRGDSLDNRQPQPRAAPLGRKERLEQPIEERRGNARPAVGDLDLQSAGVVNSR